MHDGEGGQRREYSGVYSDNTNGETDAHFSSVYCLVCFLVIFLGFVK